MKTKMVEIRDDATTIAALVIKTEGDTPQESAFWRRCGFNNHSIVVIRPDDQLAYYDPFGWKTLGTTMREAHRYLQLHFDELENGAVVDVQYIKGETAEPKASEIWG